MIQKLPNATTVLVLGILSIVGCLCYGLPGVIMGGIALFLAGKDEKLYQQNPTQYADYGNLKAGKILAIIGLILSILYLLIFIIFFSKFGVEAFTNPELLQERIREMQGQ